MKRKDRPKIKVPYATKHKIVDAFCLLGVVLLYYTPTIASWYFQKQLPVPGGSSMEGFSPIWFYTMVFAVVSWAVLSSYRATPYKYNIPVEITEENAGRQYVLAVDFMYNLKVSFMLLFLAVQKVTTLKAFGVTTFSYLQFVIIPVALLVWFSIFYIYQARTNK